MGDSMRRLLAHALPFESIKRFADVPELDAHLGRTLASAGALGVCAAESAGGLGLGAVDAVSIIIECGRHLVPWPVSETVAAHALIADHRPEVSATALNGDVLTTVALEPGLFAAPAANGWTLSGTLSAVPWAMEARWLLAQVTPVRSGIRSEPELALIDLDQPALIVRTEAKSLDLSYRVGAIDIAEGGLVIQSLLEGRRSQLGKLMSLLTAAEALGAAEYCFEQTVGYLKQRHQFKRPIGSFQALKHIVADDAVRLEGMRVALLYAAWAFDAATEDADIAVAVAKSYASSAARRIADDAIQLHGGIAYTWEFGMHLFMRRILRCAASSGTAEQHREAIAAALLDRPAAYHPAAAYQLS